MAENVTLARPYAEAAFQLARAAKGADNDLSAWQHALERMAAIAADAQLRACVHNPKLPAAELERLFLDVAGTLSAEQRNFVQVLVENERLEQLPEIRDLFIQRKNAHEKVKFAHVSSAFPLDERALAKLVAEIEPRFGCKLRADVTVDPELIGGVRVAVGDEVIDASVRGKLAAMATALKN